MSTDAGTDPTAHRERPFGRFFLPGPTEVHPDVLGAQTGAMISHRGPEIKELMQLLRGGLADVFLTERPVFISTSSATGLMEAGVRNAGRTRILSLVNGAFSKRFADIGRVCGFEVDEVVVPWGEAHDPDAVREALSANAYDAVAMAHSETSTGVLNDVAALAASIRAESDALVLVDSVSGFAAAELRPDTWGIDFLLTGSQKAFALPPGLAFGVASERMMERSAHAPKKGYYFDLHLFQKSWEKDQSPTTPGISGLFALREQLERMRAEGMESRWARHARMAELTHRWVEDEGAGAGLTLAAPEGHRSPAVTAIRSEGKPAPEIVRALRERGWLVGGGYGAWKPETFRIGHMGERTPEDVQALLVVLAEVLA